jgi:hypothetical protein
MAFVAEDGTGLANANSLCDVAFADAYFSDRAIAAWTGSTGAKQAALIQATDYIESRWARRFAGVVQFPDTPQALSFPRSCAPVANEDEVPVGIKKAASEYALRALSAKLVPDPVVDASGLVLAGSRTKVGPIETELRYQAGSALLLKAYPAADMLVRPFLAAAPALARA